VVSSHANHASGHFFRLATANNIPRQEKPMHAITLKSFGDPSVLTLSQIPQPLPGPDDLLIKVAASALNRADLLQRRGHYPPPPGASEILGMEIAGEIVGMGENVTGFGTGEKVFGLVSGGGYSEYCLLNQDMAMQIPPHLNYIEAAAIPEAFMTAQEAVFTLGQLQPGETILIHAGGSGVGSAAIQMAKQIHATIYTTTGSPEKLAKIKNFGATEIFNYHHQDFAAEILRASEQRGVNVIVDFIGAKYFPHHLAILQPGGRLIQVGLMGGKKAEIDLGLMLDKWLQIKGLRMRTRPLKEKQAITERFKNIWLPLFSTGKLTPVIDSIFPFADVKQAHEHMENNTNVGKIILSFD
jgi:putative PIG3 family NAD(P)H quinone oxidoreductase